MRRLILGGPARAACMSKDFPMNACERHFSNLVELLAHRAQADAATPWLHFQGATYSYAEIWRASTAFRDELYRRGIEPGQHVLLLLDNGPAFFQAFFGVARAGAVPVPLSPKSNGERLAYIVGDCGAALIFCDQRYLTSRFAEENLTPDLRPLLVAAEAVAGQPLLEDGDRPCAHLAFIQYTSGSTGNAKGTMISHRAVLANIASFSARFQLREGDAMSSMMPLFHDMGLICFGLGSLYNRLPLALYLQEAISLFHWLESFAKFKVTHSGGPNVFLHLATKVVRDPGAYDLGSCRMMICGSEPIFPAVVERFEALYRCPGVVKPAYGMAELSLCATLTAADETYHTVEGRFISCGRALDDTAIAILDDNGRRTTRAGVRGEVVLRSPSLMDGYLGRPHDPELFVDGFYRSGDEGFLDEQGRLYILGRRKNLIIRGGEKFSPADLESLSLTYPEVVACAVVGQTNSEDPVGFERIVLVLEVAGKLLDNPLALERLCAEICRESQRRFRYQPDRILVTNKGTLPCTSNGKLQHQKLRQQIANDVFQYNMEIVANLLPLSA